MPLGQRLVSTANRGLYRLTKGRVGGKLGKAPIGILTTAGRKSGQERAWPLMYIDDPAGWLVMASNAGNDRQPSWFLNLEATPNATFQIGAEVHPVRAEVVDDAAERADAWPRFTAIYSGYEKYTTKTDRVFPIVRLRRDS